MASSRRPWQLKPVKRPVYGIAYNSAPVQLRMPAEWEPHAATWIAWPHKESDWPGKLACIPWVYAEIVRWISKGEGCEILVRDAKQERAARDVLTRSDVALKNVRF